MTKETLLFIPGLLCNEVLWQAQLDYFQPKYNCIVADITEQATIQNMATGILKKLPQSFHVIGFSLGSWVALAMAQLVPEKIQTMSLLSATAGTLLPATRAAMEETIQKMEAGSFAEYVEILFPRYFAKENQSNLLLKNKFIKMTLDVGPSAGIRQLKALLNFKAPFQNIRDISIPTLIVRGKFDERVDEKEQEKFAETLPKSSYRIIEHAAHFVPIENPEAFSQLLSKHVREY